MFRRAIELDPDYAQAHAGLADALTELLLWRLARREDVLDEARTDSRRALELAPVLAEVQVAHAHVLLLACEHEAATNAFERAIALNPRLYEAHYYYGRHCFTCGRLERALDLLERSLSSSEGFVDWIEHDADFDSLRAMPRYRTLIARLD